MEDDLLGQLQAHSEDRAVALADGDRYCEDSEFGGCGNEAWFDITTSGLYENFATVSYTLGTHITKISPQTRTMSVTMTWTPESSRQLKISLRASRTVCPSDLDLPPGIDERVWGSTLTGAQELTLDQYDGALIISPSENMVCSFLMLDGPVSATPVILEYDEVATVGNFACLSQESGMSCWNTQTKHGMFLSRAETLTW